MFLQYLSSDPRFYFAVIFVVVISICLHELAHGLTAIYLGDKTPEESGHLTLNPLVHMGPFSLMMLAIAGISWGQMPVDTSRLRGRYGDAIVSAAGPLTNLALALLGIGGLALWAHVGTIDVTNHMVSNAVMLLYVLVLFNLVLFMLNLVPAPPLDGSRILANFAPAYRRWISDPTMQGVFLAVTIAVLIGAGKFLFPAAIKVMAALLPSEALYAIYMMQSSR